MQKFFGNKAENSMTTVPKKGCGAGKATSSSGKKQAQCPVMLASASFHHHGLLRGWQAPSSHCLQQSSAIQATHGTSYSVVFHIVCDCSMLWFGVALGVASMSLFPK